MIRLTPWGDGFRPYSFRRSGAADTSPGRVPATSAAGSPRSASWSPLPAGVLKIDRSLVNYAEGHRDRAAAAIAAIVALGRACGIRSLAEGVETAEQLALATELGCSSAQGFHIARPMPADAVPAWVAAHHAGLPAGARG